MRPRQKDGLQLVSVCGWLMRFGVWLSGICGGFAFLCVLRFAVAFGVWLRFGSGLVSRALPCISSPDLLHCVRVCFFCPLTGATVHALFYVPAGL